jgi:septum formation protein
LTTSSSPTSLWIGPAALVLASKSASRRLLLASAGIDAEIEPAAVDERRIEDEFLAAGGAPAQLAVQLARAKALEVSARRSPAWCLGADQTLTLDGQLLHKPADMEGAAQSLRQLAGRTHILTSAACVASGGKILFETAPTARLTMRPLDDGVVQRYLAAAGPAILSSVGAYQVEGLGMHLFETIEGDHSTILGLSLLDLLRWFRRQGCLAI